MSETFRVQRSNFALEHPVKPTREVIVMNKFKGSEFSPNQREFIEKAKALESEARKLRRQAEELRVNNARLHEEVEKARRDRIEQDQIDSMAKSFVDAVQLAMGDHSFESVGHCRMTVKRIEGDKTYIAHLELGEIPGVAWIERSFLK